MYSPPPLSELVQFSQSDFNSALAASALALAAAALSPGLVP